MRHRGGCVNLPSQQGNRILPHWRGFLQSCYPRGALLYPGTDIGDPGVGHLGNIGVFSYRGPRVFYADASLLKNFGVTERVTIQFRMDAFNVFNHPVLGFKIIKRAGVVNVSIALGMETSPTSNTMLRRVQRLAWDSSSSR